ncbi:MAG: GNAT family N-acetyltransferase [Candidatus Sericytochromatia bacterium]|nr:GNAT family N-acetyltransferase [Candidatus Sericytochromatia bacterium]
MLRLEPLDLSHFPALVELGLDGDVGLPASSLQLILEQAAAGTWLVRTILDEMHGSQPVGLIMVGGFNDEYTVGHMGTWLGRDSWGKGYNRIAKDRMLTLTFSALPLDEVFMAPRLNNPRALRSLEKLPYIESGVEFPTLQADIERVRGPVRLYRVSRESFIGWRQSMNAPLQQPRHHGVPGTTAATEGPLPNMNVVRGGTGPLPSLPAGAVPGLIEPHTDEVIVLPDPTAVFTDT